MVYIPTYKPVDFLSVFFLFALCPAARDEEPNFTKGINTFIRKAKLRRREREKCEEGAEIKPEHVSIENMLLGCASYEKKFL